MKIVTIILGLGTAFILSMLIFLGIRAFYPEPLSIYDQDIFPKPYFDREFNCEKDDTDCVAQRDAYYEELETDAEARQALEKEYRDNTRVYNKNFFILGNIIGMLVFFAGFMFLFRSVIAAQSIPIGIMLAGLFSIVHAYGRGWNSIGDPVKFVVGLIIAIVVIGGSAWLIQRFAAHKKGRS